MRIREYPDERASQFLMRAWADLIFRDAHARRVRVAFHSVVPGRACMNSKAPTVASGSLWLQDIRFTYYANQTTALHRQVFTGVSRRLSGAICLTQTFR